MNIKEKKAEETYPLTAGQTGVYYACAQHPKSLMYNIAFSIKLPAEIDSDKLRDAIETVLNSFSAFGTRFIVHGGEVRMVKRRPYMHRQMYWHMLPLGLMQMLWIPILLFAWALRFTSYHMICVLI